MFGMRKGKQHAAPEEFLQKQVAAKDDQSEISAAGKGREEPSENGSERLGRGCDEVVKLRHY